MDVTPQRLLNHELSFYYEKISITSTKLYLNYKMIGHFNTRGTSWAGWANQQHIPKSHRWKPFMLFPPVENQGRGRERSSNRGTHTNTLLDLCRKQKTQVFLKFPTLWTMVTYKKDVIVFRINKKMHPATIHEKTTCQQQCVCVNLCTAPNEV